MILPVLKLLLVRLQISCNQLFFFKVHMFAGRQIEAASVFSNP